ncbi:hypothetical protein LUZ60_000127 [Juncus effusus]|nr:hypothetical protein LUZ60_000127 [Juncus effusus]
MASPSSNPSNNNNNPSSPQQPQPSAPPFELPMLYRPLNPVSPNQNPPNPPQQLATSAPFYGAAAVPPGPFSYPPATPPYHIRPFIPPYAGGGGGPDSASVPRPVISYPNPNPNTSPSPNPNPNAGVRLMQLLGNTTPSHLESAVSMPPPQNPIPTNPNPSPTSAISSPILPAVPATGPARMPSTKMPRGRHLGDGDRAVHDVDSRLPGEAQAPQLEVSPITKYTSDPGLVLGRQIAVNRSYIVYGLKLGNIRVLNSKTALRSLLRGHTQRVTDMAFFAEDVHFLASASEDGRIFVWKIDEGPDEENKPQIAGKIVIALQIIGETEFYHPRICWHAHKQEMLYVGIGSRVLKIDTTKVGRGREFSAEEPLRCQIEKPVDGVHLVGKHDGDVTDLSISQWMTTRLASASKDGTVKIWDDRKSVPLATLRPHDGQPVNSVAFLTAPETPSHINLVTAGPLNREIKIWSSSSEEGWLLRSDSESWQCTQTLDLKSSSEPRLEEAFFNQVAVIPQASLIILANAKKNSIYAIHIDYGSNPGSTRMDYIADFTVAMPILSLTGTVQNGEQVVQVFCVQTMAIQQYALELSLCLPPVVLSEGGLVREPSVSRVDVPVLESVPVSVPEPSSKPETTSGIEEAVKPKLVYSESDASLHSLDGIKSPQKSIEPRDVDFLTDGQSQTKDEISTAQNARLAFNPTHLITPSEILSGALSGSSSVENLKTEETNPNFETAKEQQDETKENVETVSNEIKEESSQTLERGIGAESARDEGLKLKDEELPVVSEGKKEEKQTIINPIDSSNRANSSNDAVMVPQIQDMLQQLITTQKDMQKQMTSLTTGGPLTKEFKRIESSLGRTLDKTIKSSTDALWARLLEENAKHEKAEKERMQQLTNLITGSIGKELPAMVERAMKKEIQALGPVVARAVSPVVEKTVASVVAEAVQKGVSDKVVNQLDKSVSSKLEGAVARQIQSQFQTSGKQALQETLRTSLESAIVPAFERSCKAMFEQVDAAFHKGMSEHTAAVQQQVDSSHSPLALTLRDTINSASQMTQSLTSELLDSQRKILAIVASANTKAFNPLAMQTTNGLMPGLPEMVEAPVDPTKELTRLINERKYEEAFTMALQRSDVSLVSWLCTQVDLRSICSMVPVPLTQGVLLALLQQLACDIANDTARKVAWMTDVAVAINPTDPMIAMHVRPICEQVYNILVHHRSQPATSASDGASIKLVVHVINSVLMSCK